MKNYSKMDNFMYIFKEAWDYDHWLLIFLFLEVIFAVLTPLVGTILPSKIIASIQNYVDIRTLVIQVCSVFALYAIVQFIKTYLESRNSMQYILFRSDHFWGQVIETRMKVDYQKAETKEMKEKAESASQASSANHRGTEGIFHNSTALFTNVLGLIVYLLILSNVNPLIVLVLFLLSILSFVIFRKCDEKYQETEKRMAENAKHLRYYENLPFTVSTGKDIRLFGMHKLLFKKYDQSVAEEIRLGNKQENYMLIYYYVIETINLIRDAVCYGYLIYLLVHNSLSISSFVLYLGIVSGISNWFIQISISYGNVLQDLERVNSHRIYVDERMDVDKGVPFDSKEALDIVFDHVSFEYPEGDRKILDDFSLHIHPGEKIALVGMNGAGKTTLVKLLCGLYHPTEGKILVNGIDLETISRTDYHKLLGVLFQDAAIMSFTIGENVSGQREGDYDEERVIEALKQAGLYEYVEKLPKGIHQYINKDVEDDGISLSGGQNQKLFLARVMYKNPEMLILDEPTAALDAISEKEMYEKYNTIADKKTSVFISHRLASTKFCDRIILLKDGKIEEQGTHDELIAAQKLYYEMFEVQSKYYQEGGEAYEGNLAEC